MEWRRIKTILIFFLLTTNLLLGALYLQRTHETQQVESEAVGHLSSLLSAYGVELDEQLVSPWLAVSARPLYLQRNAEEERAWARAWIGEASLSESADQTFHYQSDEGTVTFFMGGNVFAERYVPLPSEKTDNLKSTRDFLRASGLSKTNDPKLTAGVYGAVVWSQTAGGLPVFDADLTFNYREDGLRSASGNALLGTVFWGEEPPIPSVALPLLRFFADNVPDDMPVRIDGLSLGYRSSVLKNNVTRLWPVWRLTTKSQTIYLDAYTGAIR